MRDHVHRFTSLGELPQLARGMMLRESCGVLHNTWEELPTKGGVGRTSCSWQLSVKEIRWNTCLVVLPLPLFHLLPFKLLLGLFLRHSSTVGQNRVSPQKGAEHILYLAVKVLKTTYWLWMEEQRSDKGVPLPESPSHTVFELAASLKQCGMQCVQACFLIRRLS